MKKIIFIVVSAFLLISCSCEEERSLIDLSGKWTVQLDPESKGVAKEWFKNVLKDTISLPGTTDERGLGKPEKYEDPYNALVRPHYYVGKVWYQRVIEIPTNWEQKHYILFLERCHWVTQVWVNDQYAGSQNSLCTAHEYDLTPFLEPGKHTISICVDNEYPFSLGDFASSVSEHTQSNWNGIVGRIELQVKDLVWIDDLRVFPDVENNQVKVTANVINNSEKSVTATIKLSANLTESEKTVGNKTVSVDLQNGNNSFETTFPMGDDVRCWDEFSPVLYNLRATLKTNDFEDKSNAVFGMREVGVDNKIFTVNGKRTYMRGNLECCVFPLTGYPSMNVEGWMKIMKQMKEYGLNHMRFHSWCPPDAAFKAADIMGVYIQAEAPRANVNSMPERDSFIMNELLRINEAYGNHPSFMFITTGNELNQHGPDDGINAGMVTKAKADDNRHLYSTTSGGHGMDHKESRAKVDQYRVGGARGFNNPGTLEDHSDYYTNYRFASLTHEVGQWASFPNINEIEKYNGVLKPVNLEAVRDDLKTKGMIHQAADFTAATTRHAAILYKEEIEVLMRSQDNAGFQLLSLHDYPGQGTAHVGLFDAFWDNKGGVTSKEFRKFCNPVTPLLRMKKRTFSSNETFFAKAELLNYGAESLQNITPVWKIKDEKGEILKQGTLNMNQIPQGERKELGEINADLSFVKRAVKLTVSVELEGTDYLNDWEIWCYPNEQPIEYPNNIVVYNSINKKVKETLVQGGKVLLLPSGEELSAFLPGNPKSVFWSPTWWFTKPRGGNTTMSILCNPEHPVFENFPTEYHSNWQWWSLLEMSNSIILDTLTQKVKPIIQVIDNYGRNHHLGNLFEVKIGKGKLLVCSMDIETNLENRPAARQLRNSIIEYMESDNFNPEQELAIAEIQELFK